VNIASTQAAQQTSQRDSTGVGQANLGSQDFMRLLVTQLQNQDPLEPQKGTEFTAQLAQFSSLEQLVNVNSMLAQLASLQAAVANTQAAGFIGQEVTAAGDEIAVSEGQASGAEFRLDHAADDVKITIRDGAGSVVRVIDLGGADAGTHAVEWDGLNTAGSPVPDGTYHMEIEAVSGGDQITALPLVRGIVDGIDFDQEGTFLLINGRRVALGDILGVRAPQGGA
jgi:flagellar basal-body rod modification protein FlgD